ncbi:MAG: hypothetical protein KBB39_07745 [Phycicoccus sp.]|nr:hypothetical protein [Phycicoccus sp.]
MTDPEETPNFFANRWLAWWTRRAMRRAARHLVAELKDQGVTGDYSFLGFHCDPVVWLVTRGDVERDKLLKSGLLRDLVVQRLREAGVRLDLAEQAGATAESQETVDRDFDGNWRHAMQ